MNDDELAVLPTAQHHPGYAATATTKATLARGSGSGPAQVAEPPREIGRFEIVRTLGAGGMGVVYLAQDRELHRRVALKLVRGNSDDSARTRMRREAQAMAQLDHPNVVRVYEVGEDSAGQLFIAMEFVAGQTLHAWLASPKPRAAIIDALEQARRGLAAAHAVGLVHRDFKPENVLVDDTGVVKVLDFGLARSETVLERGSSDNHRLLDASLTHAGAVLGTPYYMAPEQLAGEPATAASDQFALCVTWYEALYGTRPFQGTTLVELVTATLVGPPVPARPGSLWAPIRRGLSADPSARFPDLDALGAALRSARYRRRRLTIAGGVLAAIAASIASYAIVTHRDPVDVRADAVWNPARAAATSDAAHRMSTSSAAYLTSRLARVSEQFDARLASWRESARTIPATDAARNCIARAWSQLDTLASLATTGDPRVMALLSANLDELPDASQCLEASPDPARPAGPRIAELEQILDTLKLQSTTGAAAAAAPMLARVRPEVEAAGYPRFVVTVLEIEAKLASERSDQPARRAALERALAIAPDDRTRVRILWLLIGVVTHEAPDLAAAHRWNAELDPAYAKIPSSIPALERHDLEVQVNESHASVARMSGDLRDATARHERAVELTRAYFGEHSRDHARALEALGADQLNAGDDAKAKVTLGRALDVLRTQVGDDDPLVASFLVLLGNAKFGTWDIDGARKDYERALAIDTDAYGELDRHRLAPLGALMLLATTTNDYERVLACALAQIEIARAAKSAPELVNALAMAGLAHWQLANTARAQAELDEALALGEATYGANSDKLVVVLLSRAQLDVSMGDYPHARAASERAVAVSGVPMAISMLGMLDLVAHDAKSARTRFHAAGEKLLSADPQRIQTLGGEGRALLALGRPAEAGPLLEEAAALSSRLKATGLDVAAIDLARSQLAWPHDRARAITLARSALENLEADRRGAFYRALAPEVHAWCERVGVKP